MTRSDVLSILLVSILLAPLVAVQAGPGYAPAWLAGSFGGVPLTVCATGLWFLAMMLLAWRFAAAKSKAARSEGGQ